jgi:hypothetical protein
MIFGLAYWVLDRMIVYHVLPDELLLRRSRLADGIERGRRRLEPYYITTYGLVPGSIPCRIPGQIPGRRDTSGYATGISWPPELTEMVVVRRASSVKSGPIARRD